MGLLPRITIIVYSDWYLFKKRKPPFVEHLLCTPLFLYRVARTLLLCKRHGTPLLKIFLAFHLIHGESPVPPTVAGKALHFLVPCPDSPSRLPHPGPAGLLAVSPAHQARSPLRVLFLLPRIHGPVFPYDLAPNLLCSNVTFSAKCS